MRRSGVVVGLALCILAGGVAGARTADKITLWPFLYYSPADQQTDLEILWPAFDLKRTPEENTWRLLLTAYQFKRRNEETAWDLIWPIWRVQYDKAGQAHSRFVPLFFGHDDRLREPRGKYAVLFPELWWFSETNGNYTFHVVPYFSGRDGKEKHNILFPEFWWFCRGAGDYTIAALPWGRSRRSNTQYVNVLTPFFWGRHGEQRYGALLPLGWWNVKGKDEKTYVFFPFLHHRDSATISSTGFLPWWVTTDGDRRLVNLFPIIWQKTGAKTDALVIVPILYSVEDTDVLFPLYWRVGETRVLFPLFWKTGQTLLAIPFYGRGKTKTAKWETYGPPFYVHWATGDYSEHDVFWPVVQWGDGQNRSVHAVRPFFDFSRRGEYNQRSVLLHAVATGHGGGRDLLRVLPFYSSDRTSDSRRLALLWPLYRQLEAKGSLARQVLSAVPIGLFTMNKPADSWQALNLFWWGNYTGDTLQVGADRTHGLYPFYSSTRYHEWTSVRAKSNRDYTRVLVESSAFNLLDPLRPLLNDVSDMSKTPKILPLFSSYKRGTDTSRWQAALGLFKWERGPRDPSESKSTQQTILWLGTPFMFAYQGYVYKAKPHHDVHLFSFFWDVLRSDSRSQGLWPIYTYRRSKDRMVNASFLDPLWFWGEATGEEEHVSALFKILDYRRQPNGDSRFNFIWRAYRRDNRGDSVSWEAFPFMGWEKSPARSRFSFGWRLFEYEKTDGKRSMRVFFSPKIGLGATRQK